MDQLQNQANPPAGRRRRKRTPFEVFTEAYLPVIIGAATVVLILIFLIGSIVRGFQFRTLDKQVRHEASVAAQQELERLTKEANDLIKAAAEAALQYDFKGAITLLDSFSGNADDYPEIEVKRAEYEAELANLTEWTDRSVIPNLSFEVLIADAQRAFNDAKNASTYKKSYITTEEFKLILEQLYSNDYILIRLEDLYEYQVSDSGVSYFEDKPLYLPSGKKPLILTQTNVNYALSMVDSDGDMIADAGGAGFASKLLVDDNGNLTCQIVNSDGSVDEGAYDLIPILESFIATHPDFSYRGARAVIALTGYNGLFGYRTHAEAEKVLDPIAYSEEIAQAKTVAIALRKAGYELACNTYGNKAYGKLSTTKLEADMSGWSAEVVPILGQVDTFVCAMSSDLAEKDAPYVSDSYRVLQNAGFQYFLGYANKGECWVRVDDQYVRQGRLIVSAANLKNNPSWFNGILDPAAVLVETR